MVVLTDTVDWTEMEVRAAKIREKKLKNAAGRPPHLRATLGALTPLMALWRLPYRELEEQIRYYAPARYLCGLTETDWTSPSWPGAPRRTEGSLWQRSPGRRGEACRAGLASTAIHHRLPLSWLAWAIP